MGQTKVGRVVIDLSLGQAQFLLDLDKAGGRLKDFGSQGASSVKPLNAAVKELGSALGDHAVPQMAAASGALRVLEGNFTNNIRAAERFITLIPGMSGLLSAAFPVVGLIAFGGIIAKVGEEGYKAWRNYIDGAEKSKAALGDLVTSERVQNDSLAVTNAKLEIQIGKLSGKPGNGLKLAIEEAIASADKLGEHLNNSLKQLFEVMDKGNVGGFMGAVTARASTSYIKEFIGGESGVGGLQGQIRQENFNTQRELDAHPEKAEDIRAASSQRLRGLVDDATEQLNAWLEKAEKGLGPSGRFSEYGNAKQGHRDQEVAELQQAILATQQYSKFITGTNTNFKDTKTLEGLKFDNANAKQERPLDNELKSLDAKIKGLDVELRSIGGTDEQKTLAKAFLATSEAVARVNKELAAQHVGPLNAADQQKISSREIQIAKDQEALAFGKRVDDEIKKTREQMAAQEFLTKAIGEGFEQQKTAQAEALVFKTLGPEKYANLLSPAPTIENLNDADRVRGSARGDLEAKNIEGSALATDALQRQITQERALATAELQGAGAIRTQIEAQKELEIIRARGLAGIDEMEASQELFNATEAKGSAERVGNLIIETSAMQRMAAAYLGGSAAIRAAQLQNEIAAIRRNTPEGVDPSDEIKAATNRSNAGHQAQIAQGAGRSVNAYADQLEILQQQRTVIEGMVVTDQNRLGVEIALKSIYDAENRIIRDQTLAVGSAADGVKQFFRDIAAESESAAAKVDASMHKALDGINDQFAKMIMGQKTGWANLFKSIGDDSLKTTLGGLEKILLTGNTKGTIFGGGKGGPWDEHVPGAAGATGGILGMIFKGRKPVQTATGGENIPGSAGAGPVYAPGSSPSLGFGLRDGQSATTAYYVTLGDSFSNQGGGFHIPAPIQHATHPILGAAISGAGAAVGALSKGFGGGAPGGSVSSTFNPEAYDPGMTEMTGYAAGGYPDVGVPSIVGENGPEVFVPSTSGKIIPNGQWGGGGEKGGDTYHIDARGTDPVQTERRVAAAIAASHQSAVRTAQVANRENARRRP